MSLSDRIKSSILNSPEILQIALTTSMGPFSRFLRRLYVRPRYPFFWEPWKVLTETPASACKAGDVPQRSNVKDVQISQR